MSRTLPVSLLNPDCNVVWVQLSVAEVFPPPVAGLENAHFPADVIHIINFPQQPTAAIDADGRNEENNAETTAETDGTKKNNAEVDDGEDDGIQFEKFDGSTLDGGVEIERTASASDVLGIEGASQNNGETRKTTALESAVTQLPQSFVEAVTRAGSGERHRRSCKIVELQCQLCGERVERISGLVSQHIYGHWNQEDAALFVCSLRNCTWKGADVFRHTKQVHNHSASAYKDLRALWDEDLTRLCLQCFPEPLSIPKNQKKEVMTVKKKGRERMEWDIVAELKAARLNDVVRAAAAEGAVQCRECEVCISGQVKKLLHLLKHLSEAPYTCRICNGRFKWIRDHHRRKHPHQPKDFKNHFGSMRLQFRETAKKFFWL